MDAEKQEETTEETTQPSMEELSERLNEYQKKMEQLANTNERLLGESKQYKEKYQTVKSETEKERQLKLEKEENWKDLLDMEKNKRAEIESKLLETRKMTLKERLNFEVAKHASNAYDVDDVLNALPRDLLSIDEENLKVSGVSDAVGFLMEKKPWLFNTKVTTGQVSSRPASESPKDLSFNELPKEKQEEQFKDDLAQLFN